MTIAAPDFLRLSRLPRRDANTAAAAAVLAEGDAYHAEHGEWRLRPHQALALHEAPRLRGGLYPMGVGAGKTLLAHTLGLALDVPAERTLALVPGALVREYRRQRAVLARHFNISVPHVVSYEKVGHPSGAKLLAELAPQLIIADEAHKLSNPDSARTARFLRYAEEQQKAGGLAFVAMSASLLRNSLHDFRHLAKLALGDGSPLPHNYNMTDILDRALREEGGQGAPLMGYEWTYFAHLEQPTAAELGWEGMATWEKVRLGGGDRLKPAEKTVLRTWARHVFRRRLLSTAGVVATEEPSCDRPLRGRRWELPAICEDIAREWSPLANRARSQLLLPCGQEIEDQLASYAHARTLRMGYYTRWADLGDGTLTDREWAYARKAWNAALSQLVSMRRADLDSPALACEAIRREVEGDPHVRKYTPAEARELRAAAAALVVWEDAQHRYHGRRETVLLPRAHEYWQAMFTAIDAWARREGPALVWAEDQAVYDLANAHVPHALCLPGKHPGEPSSSVPWRLVSVPSHGTGLNLPAWQHNLFLSVPGEATNLEQLIGRTHRPGQLHDHVGLWLLPGDSFDEQAAQAEAIFLQTGQQQRLTSVQW